MTVNCDSNTIYCSENLLLMYPAIEFPDARFTVFIDIDPVLADLVQGVEFFMYTSNPQYTVYLLVLRSSLLFISIVGLIGYAWFYKNMKPENRSFEHKFIYVLSFFLVLFNDPLYALSTFFGSIVFAVFSTLHITMFFSSVFFFFIVMFPRMNKENGKIDTKFVNFQNISVTFLVFVFLSLLLSIQNVYCRFNPSIHFDTQFFY